MHTLTPLPPSLPPSLLPLLQVAWYDGASLLDSLFLCLYPHGAAIHALCTLVGVKRGQEPEGEEKEGKEGKERKGGKGGGGGPIVRGREGGREGEREGVVML